MSAVSNGRVLRIALAGSVAVHLIVAAVVYSRPVTAAPEPKPGRMIIIHVPPPPKPTPPPPKPALPHPHQNAPFHVAVHPPVIPRDNNAKGPSDNPPLSPPGPDVTTPPGVDAAPTAAPFVPAPTPTPKPACSAPDIAAKTLDAQTPVKPDDAQAQGLVGTVKVKVDLDASGAVVGANVYESSGSMELDQAALQAARHSRYAPEEQDCKNVSGSYLFTVDFQ